MTFKTAVIAFSGGLDTSFLVPFAKEKYNLDKIITCTVNTGGFDEQELEKISARSAELGADEHITINAQEEFYKTVIKYLVFGNVTRDGYPLSVGSERLIQAKKVVELAIQKGATQVFHGSTGAGNDQYRFDVAIQIFGQNKIQCLTPIREFAITRDFSINYLKEKGYSVSERTSKYSYNAGLFGVSIGGTETHLSTGLIPDDAWYSKVDDSLETTSITLEFVKGSATKLLYNNIEETNPISIIQNLTKLGSSLGIGRHYHTGTSIPGKKGRIAYESPAADILYEAHRTLEKITLTQSQIMGKKLLSDEYGKLIHEAKFFDPYRSDIEAFLESTQKRVTGTATIHLAKGYIKAVVADSPYNLLSAKGATYGEMSSFYDGRDAIGATKLHGFEQYLYHYLNGK
jgi:argininosuccinate synthase